MDKANEALREHNTRIEMMFTVGNSSLSSRWPISTVQIEKGRGKAKAIGLVASFCPLCGENLKAKQP